MICGVSAAPPAAFAPNPLPRKKGSVPFYRPLLPWIRDPILTPLPNVSRNIPQELCPQAGVRPWFTTRRSPSLEIESSSNGFLGGAPAGSPAVVVPFVPYSTFQRWQRQHVIVIWPVFSGTVEYALHQLVQLRHWLLGRQLIKGRGQQRMINLLRIG